MAEITDPKILEQINAPASGEITDPAMLQQLDLPPPVEHTSSGSQTSSTLGGLGWTDALKTLDFERAGLNTLKSSAGLLEAAAMPVYRPKETLEGLGTMGMMGIENFASNIPGFEDMPTPRKDAFKSYLFDRYGSPEALKESIETDPMGMVVDAMGVLWGGKGMAQMARKGAANALPEDLPDRWTRENAKFPRRNLSRADIDELTEFMLQEKLDFSVAGIEKLDEINAGRIAAVDRLIAKADNGETIPRAELNKVLFDMKDETLGKSAMGKADREVIDSVIDGWVDEIAAVGKNDFTLLELQKFKKGTYGKIYWPETESNTRNVRNSALKAQALDAKARIEARAPGVKEENRVLGRGLELKPLLDTATQRIDRNTGTMGQALATGQGTAWGGAIEGLNYWAGQPLPTGSIVPVTTAIGGIKGMAGNPRIKQSLAQAIYDARRADPNLIDVPLAKAMAIYLSRENQAQAQ